MSSAAFGYYADFSRTFFCGRGRPTGAQRTLYRLAYEQMQTNLALIRPGMSFRELSERAWPIPEAYVANRYFVLAHGVGMTGEYPYILHRQDFDQGYDGVIEPGMTLCVESYIGADGGADGVKLEEQVLVTERGRRAALALSVRRQPARPRALGRATLAPAAANPALPDRRLLDHAGACAIFTWLELIEAFRWPDRARGCWSC